MKKAGFVIPKIKKDDKEYLMMQLRYDGKFGFIGGLIEEGEDVIHGIVREVKEEINYNISQYERLEEFNIMYEKDLEIHTYIYNMDFDIANNILVRQDKSEHFLYESFGIIFVPITDYENTGYMEEFLNNNFSGTAKEELKSYLQKIYK